MLQSLPSCKSSPSLITIEGERVARNSAIDLSCKKLSVPAVWAAISSEFLRLAKNSSLDKIASIFEVAIIFISGNRSLIAMRPATFSGWRWVRAIPNSVFGSISTSISFFSNAFTSNDGQVSIRRVFSEITP